MPVAVIASMKKGLEHFVYREMCEFSRRGVSIRLFPTKRGPGLYEPRDDWKVCAWRAWLVLCGQPVRFFRRPIVYLTLLFEALRYGAVVDFVLAAYFAPHMR